MFAKVLFLAAVASTTLGAVLLVDDTGSDTSNCTISACATVQYAIDQSVSSDVIQILPGNYYEGNINFGGRAINVQGQDSVNPPTINSGGARAFVFNNSETSSSILSNIVITNSSDPDMGGAIFIQDASPVLQSILVNFATSPEGAGIAVVGASSNPSLIDCSFSNNVASVKGGAGSVTDGASIVIQRGSSLSNSAVNGGAWFFEGNVISLEMHTMQQNAASVGGAVAAFATESLTMTDCEVANNQALTGSFPKGGGVLLQSTPATITSCQFENNESRDGGAVSIVSSVVSIVDSEFNDNTAQDDGGAIHGTGATTVVDIGGAQTEIVGNTAAKAGGGIAATASSTFNLDSVTGLDNEAAEGGFAQVFDASMTIEFSTLKTNLAGESGGALAVESSTVAFTSVTIKFNQALVSGGAVYCVGDSTIDFTTSDIAENTGLNLIEDHVTCVASGDGECAITTDSDDSYCGSGNDELTRLAIIGGATVGAVLLGVAGVQAWKRREALFPSWYQPVNPPKTVEELERRLAGDIDKPKSKGRIRFDASVED